MIILFFSQLFSNDRKRSIVNNDSALLPTRIQTLPSLMFDAPLSKEHRK